MVKVPESTRPRTAKECPCSSFSGRGCNDFTSISVYPSSLRRVSNSCLSMGSSSSLEPFHHRAKAPLRIAQTHLKDPLCMPRPLIHRVSQFLQLAPGAHLMAFYSLYPLRNVMG